MLNVVFFKDPLVPDIARTYKTDKEKYNAVRIDICCV